MAAESWEKVARALAARVANYIYPHGHATPRDDCPWCRDKIAYDRFVAKANARKP